MIPEVIQKLKPFLNPGRKELAKKTADAISRLQAKQFFVKNLQNYDTLNEAMKTRLLMEIKNISPAKDVEFLILSLSDDSPWVRAVALKSAADLNDPRLIEKILPLIKDSSPNVRKLSYEFLGKFPIMKIAEVLNSKLMDEKEEEPLLTLIEAIGNIGAPDSLTLLLELLAQDRGDKISAKIIENVGKLKL